MRRITCRSAINEALREEMEIDAAVILLGEDIRESPPDCWTSSVSKG